MYCQWNPLQVDIVVSQQGHLSASKHGRVCVIGVRTMSNVYAMDHCAMFQHAPLLLFMVHYTRALAIDYPTFSCQPHTRHRTSQGKQRANMAYFLAVISNQFIRPCSSYYSNKLQQPWVTTMYIAI
jgi:hypothetical protein